METNKQIPKKTKLRNAEYYNFQEIQDKLYQQSKTGKTFKNLMEIITSEENILLAYRNIKKNKGSKTAGVDGMTINNIHSWKTENFIKHIRKKLQWYQPKAVRRVEIPKPNGKTRPLGIPTIIDRIIQQCILQVLEPICEAKFHERNNGFRPCRSTEHALAQMYKYVQISKLYWVVDIDIKGFFDNVNHGKLLKQIWTIGIRDKKLLCILSAMLKAEIAEIGFPSKGTPQGGIISPLLSNIVLNELDWWITSQWENMPTKTKHEYIRKDNGKLDKGPKYKTLREKSKLKECYIIRYADDFKIICRNKEHAERIFIATKKWLKERLGLEISNEKSKIVNLKTKYSEYLGFKIKAIPKGKDKKGNTKYAIKSGITNKAKIAIQKEANQYIKQMQKTQNTNKLYETINKYNAFIMGIHNYYNKATNVNIEIDKIAFIVKKNMRKRLRNKIKKDNNKEIPSYILKKYRNSKQLRFIGDIPILPLGYVQHVSPMNKKTNINRYTIEGRKEIHKNLESINPYMLIYLMKNYNPMQSIEYNDNRIAVYVAQKGKCAISGEQLKISQMHCHHIIPKKYGGSDQYDNLIFITDIAHKYIHASNEETLKNCLNQLKLNNPKKNKLDKLRQIANQQEKVIYPSLDNNTQSNK